MPVSLRSRMARPDVAAIRPDTAAGADAIVYGFCVNSETAVRLAQAPGAERPVAAHPMLLSLVQGPQGNAQGPQHALLLLK